MPVRGNVVNDRLNGSAVEHLAIYSADLGLWQDHREFPGDAGDLPPDRCMCSFSVSDTAQSSASHSPHSRKSIAWTPIGASFSAA